PPRCWSSSHSGGKTVVQWQAPPPASWQCAGAPLGAQAAAAGASGVSRLRLAWVPPSALQPGAPPLSRFDFAAALAAAEADGAAAADAAAGGLGFWELPGEVLQHVMDLLPSFRDRLRLCSTCAATSQLEWRL
ncbi:unnamed protein product, partial [Prorocentrum cordatum]